MGETLLPNTEEEKSLKGFLLKHKQIKR